MFTLILKMTRFSLSRAEAPEWLKADSGRLEGEDVHQTVLELVHLHSSYRNIVTINVVNMITKFKSRRT